MSDRNLVVLWAGNVWDGLPATDHHLARALARRVDVLWVDPPRSVIAARSGLPVSQQVSSGLRVFSVPTPPAPSRAGLRQLSDLQQQAVVAAELVRLRRKPWATMSFSARASLPRTGGGTSVLHVTDDWIAGAAMMGLDATALERTLRTNVRRADVVSAVSIDLGETLQRMNPRHPVEVVPNAATMPEMPEGSVVREPVAVLIGQLNERLDIAMLDAVVDAGITLRILGPRTDREPEQTARLDRLLARDGVDWRGAVPHDEVGELLATATVGLTPYLINDFNRSSFPLKTLEYLAVGLPVVSTPLESLDWLGTDLVDVAGTPEEFATAVKAWIERPFDPALLRKRRAFAEEHSWDARAGRLLELVDDRIHQDDWRR